MTKSEAGASSAETRLPVLTDLAQGFEAITVTKVPVVREGSTPFYNNGDYSGIPGGRVEPFGQEQERQGSASGWTTILHRGRWRILNLGVEGRAWAHEDGKLKLTDETIKNPEGPSGELALGKHAMGGWWEASSSPRPCAGALLLDPTQKESSMRADQL